MGNYRDICVSHHDRKLIKNLLHVLDLILNYNPNHKDLYSVKPTATQKPLALGRTSVQFLNESLLSHRFQESCKLLWLMSQEKTSSDMILYKGIMIVLENLQFMEEPSTVWNLFSNFQNLKLLFKKDVLLEYIMYALRHDIPDLHASCQDLISQKHASWLKKHAVFDVLLPAYQALLDYVTWKKYMFKEDTLQLSKNAAEKAIAVFKNLVYQPGIWDIFILKLVEMLEYNGNYNEIEDILKKYVETHSDHINAYIYLCVYLYKNNTDLTSFIHYTEILAKKCPSDIRVLMLVQKWNELGEKRKKSLNLLFKFLDYPVNALNLTAWELLLNLLNIIQKSNKNRLFEFAQKCWKFRQSSWNIIHFSVPDITAVNENMKKILILKVQILFILEQSHKYISEILKFLPTIKMDQSEDVHLENDYIPL